jgi:HSP20 family molecular chaperone IbpA
MFRPSIFGEDLFDDFMYDFPFGRNFGKQVEKELAPARNQLYGKREKNLMSTDVRETEGGYELDVDLPGFKKEDIKVKLTDGYLTIAASKQLNKDEKEEKSGKYIRRERYTGAMSRTFYVGDEVTQEEIHAKFEDGILKLSIPKKEEKKAVEKDEFIAIE